MKRSFLFLLLGTYALFLAGCYTPGDDDDFEPQTITPVLIAKGENCFAESLAGTNMVIKTDEAWNELLNTLSGVTDGFTETEIDFSQYMVLALFEEVKGVGGWSIDITGVTEHANKIVVAYTNQETGDATEVISQPYHIVRIPKSDKEVVFERTGGDANGKIIGYTNCQGNFGLFIITEQQDSLLSFNISPSSVNIDRDLSKPGAYPIENINITFTYRIAYGEEVKPWTELVCPQNAMDPAFGGLIETYKQVIVTNITRQQP